jgi:CheY-like chemotaxis protein
MDHRAGLEAIGAVMSEAPGQREPESRGNNARKGGILIADDMPFILTMLKFEMEFYGFNTWLAVDGDDALELYRRHRDKIDLVLLDVQMPGMDGPHTLEVLRRLNPDIVACFMSGNAGNYTEEELQNRGAAWVFNKPFPPVEVAHLLQRILSKGNHDATRNTVSLFRSSRLGFALNT